MSRVMTEEQRAAKRAYDLARYPVIREKAIAKAKAHYEANREAKKVAAGARYSAKKAEILAKEKAKRLAAIAADPAYRDRENELGRARYARSDDAARQKRLSYQHEWRAANAEKVRAQQRARYWANPERARLQAIKDVENRRARKIAAGGEFTVADIAELRNKQKGKCAWCLRSLGNATPHIDHYVPLALGGSNDVSNLRLLHGKCNLEKHAKHPTDFGLRNGLLAW